MEFISVKNSYRYDGLLPILWQIFRFKIKELDTLC